jgi:hypothetical protein
MVESARASMQMRMFRIENRMMVRTELGEEV